MAHYVILANFTDQGIRAVKDTTKRAQAFRKLVSDMGGVVEKIYWTLGRHDVILTMEAPSDEVAAAILAKAGSLGNLKSETLRAFNESEVAFMTGKI